VIDQTHDPVFWQSPADGFRFVYVNEAACQHFGRPAEALLRMSVPDIDPNYPLEEMQRHWQELKRRRAITIETVNRRASGEVVPVEVTTNYVLFDGEEYVAGTIRDISERKRAEDALRASEARFRTLVDHATDAFALCDEHGILVDVNRQACESLGYRREELIGMSGSDVDPDVDVDALLKRFAAGEQILTFESRHRRKDGTLFPVEVRARHFVSPEGRALVFVLVRDITERKRAEEALRESEERYRALIEVSPQIVWMARADGSNIFWNQRWYDYTGLTRAESEGFGWVQAVHPEHRDRHVDLWRQALASSGEWNNEAPLRRADGQYRWHLGRGLPIRDADGQIVRWMGIGMDVHDRREAEDALRRSEAWLSEAQRLSHTGSWVLGLETDELKHWSPELLRICGFDPDAEIPSIEAMRDRVHPADRAKYVEEVATAIRERRGVAGERRLVLPDGTIRHLQTVVSPVFDAAGRPIEVIGTAMDVTERKSAEQALRVKERELGRLLDVLPQQIFVLEDDLSLAYANQTLLDSHVSFDERSAEEAIPKLYHPDDIERTWEGVRRSVSKGVPYEAETRILGRSGEYRRFLVRMNPLKDESGRVMRWYGTETDIEESRCAQEALRESEERYRALIEVSPQMVWVARADGSNIFWNQWWYDYTGLTRAESEGFDWMQAVHPEHREQCEEFFRQALASGAPWSNEAPVRRAADGQYRWHFGRGLPIRDADGEIVRWMGICVDIHDRREAEEALRLSEAWLSEAQRLSHTGSWAMNLETRELTHYSPELLRMCGFDPDAGIPSTEAVRERTHPEDRAKNVEDVETAIRERTGVAGERRLVLPDGTIRHLQTVVSPVFDVAGRPIEIIGTAMDVTERKQAEQAARESEQRYRRSEAYLAEAQTLSHTGNWAMNLETRRVVYWSQELFGLFDFDPEEGIPSTEGMLRRIHPDDRVPVLAALRRAVREKTVYDFDCRVVRPDGTTRYVHTAFSPILNAAGDAEDMIGTVMDTTAGKQAEEALRASEQRYRNIFEKVGVAIVEEDFSKVMARLGDLKARGVQDFRRYLAEHPELARETFALIEVRDLNEAAVALFGATSKQEFLDAVPRLATREVRAAWVAQLIAVAEGRRSVEEVVLTTIGGETVHALVALVLPPESSGFESVLVTVVDLSERKRAEEALNRAQAALAHVTRVTMLGELTASIAHEVNQPLAAIVNNASACLSLLSHEPADVEELRAALADITGDAERASAVIERVRGLAKRSAPERIPVRLTALVREVMAMTAAEAATRRVRIRTDIPADLPLVLADRVQLQQVLLNLVVNAMDAMSNTDQRDRSLDIRGRLERLDGSRAVTISVEDRGVGIQPEELDRLFEAFYTTKPHGMGLGLAISRSIIEAHGGRLWGESRRGRGAVFSFRLPAAETCRTA
jgi:PAS domain S-box-containing protein